MLKVRSPASGDSCPLDSKSLEKNNCSVGRCHLNGDFSGQGGPGVGSRSELIRGFFNTRLGPSNKPLGCSAAVRLAPERLRTFHYCRRAPCALHSKCPRGPRGSQGAGDSRVGPPPRPIAAWSLHTCIFSSQRIFHAVCVQLLSGFTRCIFAVLLSFHPFYPGRKLGSLAAESIADKNQMRNFRVSGTS